jgi:hypothetical protein
MSRESGSDYKEALMGLKKNQVVDLIKKAREVLELNTTGKTKNKLVEDLLNLHGSDRRPNLFMGKPLLSFAKDSHIKIPAREARVDRKAEKAAKEAAKVEREKKAQQETKKRQVAELDKQIAESKETIRQMEEKQKENVLRLINAKKRERAKQSRTDERKRKFNSLMEVINDLKRRSKGASKEKIAELRKELEAAKKQFKIN